MSTRLHLRRSLDRSRTPNNAEDEFEANLLDPKYGGGAGRSGAGYTTRTSTERGQLVRDSSGALHDPSYNQFQSGRSGKSKRRSGGGGGGMTFVNRDAYSDSSGSFREPSPPASEAEDGARMATGGSGLGGRSNSKRMSATGSRGLDMRKSNSFSARTSTDGVSSSPRPNRSNYASTPAAAAVEQAAARLLPRASSDYGVSQSLSAEPTTPRTSGTFSRAPQIVEEQISSTYSSTIAHARAPSTPTFDSPPATINSSSYLATTSSEKPLTSKNSRRKVIGKKSARRARERQEDEELEYVMREKRFVPPTNVPSIMNDKASSIDHRRLRGANSVYEPSAGRQGGIGLYQDPMQPSRIDQDWT